MIAFMSIIVYFRLYQWQIMGTISDCLHLKVNLKKKIYPYVNSTTKRCVQTKYLKLF
jgi:hypothetical protein